MATPATAITQPTNTCVRKRVILDVVQISLSFIVAPHQLMVMLTVVGFGYLSNDCGYFRNRTAVSRTTPRAPIRPATTVDSE